MEPGSKDTQAPSPFGDPSADLILRSSDGVEFRVHTLYLRKSSDFFDDMLSLPQPPSPNTPVPVVDCCETSTTLHAILSFCYPSMCPPTTFPNARDILDICFALEKFLMLKNAEDWIKRLLTNAVTSNPVAVYILAHRFGWEEEVKLAAKQTLFINLYELIDLRSNLPVEVLDRISALAMHRLDAYHTACWKLVQERLSAQYWVDRILWELVMNANPDSDPYRHTYVFQRNIATCCSELIVADCEGNTVNYYVKKWWKAYMDDARAAVDAPAYEKVLTTETMLRAVRMAAECRTCAPEAMKVLHVFTEQCLKVELKKQLDKVALKID
ncbi:unnamed protein product [Somion occarium]|uniref:BTB domain-containing protein n=1 Tax=Somion occarium TaxID=3059160 RepID=A0ABP1D6S9_9APHY